MTPSCLEYIYITHQKTFLVRKDGRESPLFLVHQLFRQLGYFTGLFFHAWSRKLSCMIYWLRLSFPQLTPSVQFSSVQLLSCVWLFATLWTAARQTSLSITNSWNLLKLMSIESVMPSNHLILCHPLLLLPSIFQSSGSFPINQFFTSDGQSIRVSASASVLPMNIQDWFPLGLTGLISLQPKRLSRVFSNTTVQKYQFLALSFLYSPTLISIHDYWKNRSFY